MADYGHELAFGTFITPTAADAQQVVELARLTELVGLDLVSFQDHPYQARHLDTWTLLSVVAAQTQTVRLSPNVANLPLRPPVVLARSVATLDLLSGGRVDLGLGAGSFYDAIAAVGGPRLTAGRAIGALAEAIDVIRAVWDAGGGPLRHEGEHYRVKGAHPGPAPAHDVEIWLGAYKPRMLALTGAKADGWLPSQPYAGPDALPAMNAAIDEAATAAGRRPADVRRLYNIGGRFGTRAGSGFLAGAPADWTEQLAELALTQGMSTFILMGDDPDFVRRFAAEVAPAVRELVDKERGRSDRQVKVASAAAAGQPSGGPAGGPISSAAGPVGSVAGPLTVVPTPDDGTRLSAEQRWDESTRPAGPAPDPRQTFTADQQAAGQHLVDIHDHLRGELEQLRDLIEQVAAGTLDPGAARSMVNAMTMRQNNWTLGVYCTSYCRMVTGHHTLEDRSVFPHLRGSDARLAPVIDRLEEEHRVIAEVIDQVDRALVALVSEPDGIAAVRAALDLLTDTMRSHLSYEERELVEPLARLGYY